MIEKELSWVLQLDPLKNPKLASLMVHLMGLHWYEKTELHFDLQIDLLMGLNLCLRKELSWVLQLDHLKDTKMAILMVYLIGSHWDEKTELQWDPQMELQMEV